MLKLKGISGVIKTTIVFDFYVPISIEFGDWEIQTERNIYWRSGNLKNTLIEIGIGAKSGTVSKITIVCASKIQISGGPSLNIKRSIRNGRPFFDVDAWSSNLYHVDEIKDFDIYKRENSFIILFNTDVNIMSSVINGRVVFGFDKNKLLNFIEVKDLTADEMKIFSEACMHDVMI